METVRRLSMPAVSTAIKTMDGSWELVGNLTRSQFEAIGKVTRSAFSAQQALIKSIAREAARAGGRQRPKLTESFGLGDLPAEQAQAVAAKAVREVRSKSKREVEGPAPSPEEVRELLSSRPTRA